MNNIFTVLVFLLSTAGLMAQDFDKAKMDSLFSRLATHDKGMGSISIYKDGAEIYQNAIGYASIADKIPANKKTKYRIGSISKTFTADIVIQIIEENKLSYDTPLAKFFPKMPNAQKITIEHLLRHRSGLFNFTNKDTYGDWSSIEHSKAELLKKFITNGTVFEPDEKAEYSNTNYVLLSYIAEKIDKKEFATILQDRITKPLQLANTYYGEKIDTKDHEALSYRKISSWEKETETDMSIPVGAGALVSTPSDLNIFFNQLFKGNVIPKTALERMKKPVERYGMGLFQFPFDTKTAIGHNGGIDGFQSMAAYFEEEKLGVAYISNGVAMPVNDILIGVLSIYFGEDYQLPEFKPGLVLKSEDLDPYLGIYAAPDFPLKITITKKENVLIAQATGQGAFPLEAFDEHQFKFDAARLKLEFIPAKNQMILRQGGGEYTLTKE